MKTTPRLTNAAEVSHLLARAVPYSVTGETSVDAMTDGAEVYALTDGDGNTVGAFAMVQTSTQAGDFIDVAAAGGLPGHDLAGDMSAFTTEQARQRGALGVRCITRRRGLVERLKREGWTVAGYVLKKEI